MVCAFQNFWRDNLLDCVVSVGAVFRSKFMEGYEMTLDELERLADTAAVLDHNEQDGWYEPIYIEEQGAYYPKNARFISACDPLTIKSLIALCRLQHEAIQEADSMLEDSGAYIRLRKALAAYEEFGK